MRLRIHHPLFAGFLGVVGLVVVVLVPLIGRGLSRELHGAFRADLERHLALGVWIVSNRDTPDPERLAREITERIGYRVSFIDTMGVVRGDSYVEPDRLGEVENHIGRPEVQAVLTHPGQVAFASRVSATVGASLLYGSRLTELGGEPMILRIAAPETEIERVVARVQRTVAATGAIALLFALVAAYLLSRAYALPVARMAEGARRLADGDLGGRLPDARVAELHDLSAALNRLTDELQARLSELRLERDGMETLIDCMAEGVVAISEDGRLLRTNRAARAILGIVESPQPGAPIDTVVRSQVVLDALHASVQGPEPSREIEVRGRKLLVASRALDVGGAVTTFLDISEIRRLEKVRRDFVANASHELKTPLTAIRGFAETLLESEPPEELRRTFLESIEKNTLRLQRLVDDLLDISRLESGTWKAESVPVRVEDAAAEAWVLVEARADEAGVAFSLEGAAEILGDHDGLVHCFRNLFENAVRHTESGGHVDVRIVGSSDRVEVEVEDDGEGIPEEALSRIFERFYRADSSRARDFGGTGLGLSIVRHLVVSMGGRVEAESLQGIGTTIRMRFPAAPEA